LIEDVELKETNVIDRLDFIEI